MRNTFLRGSGTWRGNKALFGFFFKQVQSQGGRGGGYLGFQVTGMIEWSQKSRPKKIPRASSKTQKNPWTKNADYCITRAM